jgi:hypothetical protein
VFLRVTDDADQGGEDPVIDVLLEKVAAECIGSGLPDIMGRRREKLAYQSWQDAPGSKEREVGRGLPSQ